jgi:thiamine-monophosphate kinase
MKRRLANRRHPADRTIRVGKLGEKALIRRLEALLPVEPGWVRVGRGLDDVAVLESPGRWLLLTCDAQIEGQHFRRDWITPRALGRRAASVNLSDIAAMGGQPVAAVASLQLPGTLPVRFYDELMRGLGEELDRHGAALVGGNLARARNLSIDVTLLGTMTGRRVVRRAGARPGDRVLVTGAPGEAAAGLAIRRAGKPGGRGETALVRRFLQPTARLREGQRLAAAGATSMIDLSDGLTRDLLRVCDASRVGVEIDVAALPASGALRRAALRLGMDVEDWILAGGESYELLCTAPPRLVATLQRRVSQLGVPLTDIGAIRPSRHGRWLRRGEQRVPLRAGGFDHFGG